MSSFFPQCSSIPLHRPLCYSQLCMYVSFQLKCECLDGESIHVLGSRPLKLVRKELFTKMWAGFRKMNEILEDPPSPSLTPPPATPPYHLWPDQWPTPFWNQRKPQEQKCWQAEQVQLTLTRSGKARKPWVEGRLPGHRAGRRGQRVGRMQNVLTSSYPQHLNRVLSSGRHTEIFF